MASAAPVLTTKSFVAAGAALAFAGRVQLHALAQIRPDMRICEIDVCPCTMCRWADTTDELTGAADNGIKVRRWQLCI